MPVYEYVCRGCRHGFETLVLGSDVPTCPQCRATDLQRVLSVAAIGRSASATSSPAPAMGGGCGSCGDPRGPGACALD
ncbi:MAG: zinc ribbon domain-containing protein [Deltaproteobacteria bacterium]|nr:zinc ribbon domain-containing protein [Deltaproteobacteria bacterium]